MRHLADHIQHRSSIKAIPASVQCRRRWRLRKPVPHLFLIEARRDMGALGMAVGYCKELEVA